jgi:ABC-type bacteriocin/lantibiotic exporter with double-glycine peptidase domain
VVIVHGGPQVRWQLFHMHLDEMTVVVVVAAAAVVVVTMMIIIILLMIMMMMMMMIIIIISMVVVMILTLPQGAIMNTWSTRWNMGWWARYTPASFIIEACNVLLQVCCEGLRRRRREFSWQHQFRSELLRQYQGRLGGTAVRCMCSDAEKL